MGAASSSNVSKAVANVSNFVSASTTADSDQVANVMQTTVLSECYVGGNFEVTNVADVYVSSQQIVTGIQTADLQNNISQQMMQEAQSTIGSMGIGFAGASNSASTFANATNTVKNSVSATSSQGVNVLQDTICSGSHIEGSVLVNNTSQNEFYSEQTLKQSQTANIVNDVSQTISQKATAKVEGLAGFLLALALCIVALGVGFGGALKGAGDAAKPVLIAGVAIGLACLMAWMYVAKAPPLFAEEDDCCPIDLSMGGCDAPCINVKESEINLTGPPLRYCYSILDTDVTNDNPGSLLGMAISQWGNGSGAGAVQKNNGGYNAKTWSELQGRKDTTFEYIGVKKCPELLSLPTTDGSDQGYVYQINDDYLANGGCSPGIMTSSRWGSTDDSPRCEVKTHANTELDYYKTLGGAGQYVTKENMLTTSGVELDQILAQLNIDEWTQYLTSESTLEPDNYPNDTLVNRQYHARFYLSKLCQIRSTYAYTVTSEEVEYIAPDNPDFTIFGTMGSDNWYQVDADGNIDPFNLDFDPKKYPCLFSGFPSWPSKLDPIQSGGKMKGLFGVCNNRTYQLHKAMKTWGGWLGLIVIIILFVMLGTHGKTWGTGKGKGKGKGKGTAPKAAKK